MRRIEHSASFKRDRRRESKGRHRAGLNAILTEALQHLVYDLSLGEQYRDHALAGNWSDHRDCHLKPDLILIYRKIDDDVLQLVRFGSHSKLGLWGNFSNIIGA